MLYALGIGGSECPLKPSNGAGALILRGAPGLVGFRIVRTDSTDFSLGKGAIPFGVIFRKVM